jgi:hypothetical protein
MKAKDIEQGEYITGPPTRIWDGLWNDDERIPYRLSRVLVVDARMHKAQQSRWHDPEKPRLVTSGDKPNLSFYVVGPLVRRYDAKGNLGEPTVVAFNQVLMPFEEWKTERARRIRDERKRAAEQRVVEKKREARRAATRAAAESLTVQVADLGLRVRVVDGELALVGNAEQMRQVVAGLVS